MPESALCAVARARGAACEEVDGWRVPANFDDPRSEYDALRDAAAIVDLAFHAMLRVTGPDRVDFLQGMLSNDVTTLQVGEGCRALLLTEQGKIVADCVVLALADAILIEGFASAMQGAAAGLARYVVADDVEIETVGSRDHVLGLYGPQALSALARLGVPSPPATPYTHAAIEVAGTVARIVRVPAPGAGGYLCVVPSDAVPGWWQRCAESGIRAAGQRAFEVLRIESGVPWCGRELGADTLALEAPVRDAINFAKGCYLGQEVVERISARGHVNRKLVGLDAEPGPVPVAGDAIFTPERQVGQVTSACWSWRRARPVALGYVRREQVGAGTRLEIRGAAGTMHATVRPLAD